MDSRHHSYTRSSSINTDFTDNSSDCYPSSTEDDARQQVLSSDSIRNTTSNEQPLTIPQVKLTPSKATQDSILRGSNSTPLSNSPGRMSLQQRHEQPNYEIHQQQQRAQHNESHNNQNHLHPYSFHHQYNQLPSSPRSQRISPATLTPGTDNTDSEPDNEPSPIINTQERVRKAGMVHIPQVIHKPEPVDTAALNGHLPQERSPQMRSRKTETRTDSTLLSSDADSDKEYEVRPRSNTADSLTGRGGPMPDASRQPVTARPQLVYEGKPRSTTVDVLPGRRTADTAASLSNALDPAVTAASLSNTLDPAGSEAESDFVQRHLSKPVGENWIIGSTASDNNIDAGTSNPQPNIGKLSEKDTSGFNQGVPKISNGFIDNMSFSHDNTKSYTSDTGLYRRKQSTGNQSIPASIPDKGMQHRKSSLGVNSYALRSGRTSVQGFNRKIKIILVGDPGVGKSTFLQALISGPEPSQSGSRVDLYNDNVSMPIEHAGLDVDLDIQDTAGQERFRSLTASYYRYAQGCLLFFNVNHKETFENVSGWLDDINMYNSQNETIAVVLVGMLHTPRKTKVNPASSKIDTNGSISNNNSSQTKPRDMVFTASTQTRGFPLRHSRSNSELASPPVANGFDNPFQARRHKFGPREIPREQAEHMAATWGIPYTEVDPKGNYDSIEEALHSLLDLIFHNAVEQSRAASTVVISPGITKRTNRNYGSAKAKTASSCCFR